MLHPILSLWQTHALGLRDIEYFGNDYNPNKVGAIKSQAPWVRGERAHFVRDEGKVGRARRRWGTCRRMRAAFSVNASPGRKRLRPPVPNCPRICGAVVTGKCYALESWWPCLFSDLGDRHFRQEFLVI